MMDQTEIFQQTLQTIKKITELQTEHPVIENIMTPPPQSVASKLVPVPGPGPGVGHEPPES